MTDRTLRIRDVLGSADVAELLEQIAADRSIRGVFVVCVNTNDEVSIKSAGLGSLEVGGVLLEIGELMGLE